MIFLNNVLPSLQHIFDVFSFLFLFRCVLFLLKGNKFVFASFFYRFIWNIFWIQKHLSRWILVCFFFIMDGGDTICLPHFFNIVVTKNDVGCGLKFRFFDIKSSGAFRRSPYYLKNILCIVLLIRKNLILCLRLP